VKFTRSAALALVAVLAVAACSSTPSAKAVAEDYVESIEGLSTEQRQCMLEKLDGYSEDELEAIGNANLDVDFDQADAVESATPEFQDFVENLNSCMTSAEG
jgi:ABC-type glycerol-3-phosphate transport system substrate-binding protein